MDYFWDTNILVHYIRESDKYAAWNQKYQFFNEKNRVFLSIVNIGEIYSLAYQLHWQRKKMDRLQHLLQSVNALPIARKNIVQSYAIIDAYSQGKLTQNPLPKSLTARNMGKNDLWIAATVHITKTTLVTTDRDFDHLNRIYLDVIRL